jgi:hypothetical protein
MFAILAAQEAEIRRITIQGLPRQIVRQEPISRNNSSHKKAGGVAQGVVPEFKPQHHKTNKQAKRVQNIQ